MRIILCGPGASGKDHLKRIFESKGFKRSVSYTTRPARLGEVDGVDYYFISEDEFMTMMGRGEFREWNKFADKWYYGTSKKHFKSANLFIMTPSGIAELTEDERKTSVVMYLDIPEHIRYERLSDPNRSGADSPERRLATDRADFLGFSDFDVKISNPDF